MRRASIDTSLDPTYGLVCASPAGEIARGGACCSSLTCHFLSSVVCCALVENRGKRFHNARLSHTHDSHDRQGADDGFLGQRIKKSGVAQGWHHTPLLKIPVCSVVAACRPPIPSLGCPFSFFLSFGAVASACLCSSSCSSLGRAAARVVRRRRRCACARAGRRWSTPAVAATARRPGPNTRSSRPVARPQGISEHCSARRAQPQTVRRLPASDFY